MGYGMYEYSDGSVYKGNFDRGQKDTRTTLPDGEVGPQGNPAYLRDSKGDKYVAFYENDRETDKTPTDNKRQQVQDALERKREMTRQKNQLDAEYNECKKLTDDAR